jgi:PIN domain nuclease of toxin-antitoxin system
MAAVNAPRALLDTHALLWWLAGDKRLSAKARRLIEGGSTIFVSAASAWEIATKVRIGRLPGAVEVARRFEEILDAQGFRSLDITVAHARHAGLLAGPHRDPFDRMLIAQAELETIPIVSTDPVFDVYPVNRFW